MLAICAYIQAEMCMLYAEILYADICIIHAKISIIHVIYVQHIWSNM